MSFPIAIATCTAVFFNFAACKMMKKYYPQTGLFNPLSIFFAVWLCNLIGYEADGYFKYFCYRLSIKADVWLALTFVFFFCGAWLALELRPKKTVSPHVTTDSFNKLWYCTLFFLCLFLLAILYKYYLLTHYYHGLLGHFGQIKDDIFDHKFHFPFFLYFFTLPEYLVGINLGILTIFNRQKTAIILSLLGLVLAYCNASFSGMRGGFLNYFLIYFSSLGFAFVMNHKIKMQHYLFLIGIVSSLFLILALSLYLRSAHPHNAERIMRNFATSFVDQNEGRLPLLYRNYKTPTFIKGLSTFFDGPKSKEYSRSSLLETLYIHNFAYFVGPLPAYAYFLDAPWDSEYWGKWTFYGIYSGTKEFAKALHFKVLNHLDDKVYYAPIVLGPFNSTNYLTYIFSDFGYIGLILVPGIMGFVANWCFLTMLATKKIQNIPLTSLLCTGLILTVRSIITNGVYFWVTIILILFQNWYISRKSGISD